jgi:hypothetical protein
MFQMAPDFPFRNADSGRNLAGTGRTLRQQFDDAEAHRFFAGRRELRSFRFHFSAGIDKMSG